MDVTANGSKAPAWQHEKLARKREGVVNERDFGKHGQWVWGDLTECWHLFGWVEAQMAQKYWQASRG